MACRAASSKAAGAAASSSVLLVESPAKARKIQAFLGDSYKVTFEFSPRSTCIAEVSLQHTPPAAHLLSTPGRNGAS